MKAILVIDMPKECCECPCFYDYLHCQAKDGVNVLGYERPNECPLKPMPQNKEIIGTKYIKDSNQYALGWNDCIKEILGDQK